MTRRVHKGSSRGGSGGGVLLQLGILAGGFLAGRLTSRGKGRRGEEAFATPAKSAGGSIAGTPDSKMRRAIHDEVSHLATMASPMGVKQLKFGGDSDTDLSIIQKKVILFPTPLVDMLKRCEDWDFDVFACAELDRTANGGQCLATVAYYLFHEYRLPQTFDIPDSVLVAWLQTMEAGYADLPFHSALHAADVLLGVHHLLQAGDLLSWMEDVEVLGLLVAAVILDYGHPGVSNQFLVNAGDARALLYNDVSVLENHHCACAFMAMRSEGCGILGNLPAQDRAAVRSMVIQLVLSTDMAEHFNFVNLFRTRCSMGLEVASAEDRMTILKMVLKTADIAYVARPPEAAARWGNMLAEEFFAQGEQERALGLAVSPLCDRATTDVAKSQAGFIAFIAQPLIEAFALFSPAGEGLLLRLTRGGDQLQLTG